MKSRIIKYKDIPLDPMRAIIYSPPGLGKTSLAASFPNNVFLQTEDGRVPDVDFDAFEFIENFHDIQRCMSDLYNDDHDYKTFTIDTLDRLEAIVWAETCRRHGWRSLEEPGYGKGYAEADAVWEELLQGFGALRRDRGMTSLFLAHSEIKDFNDPETVAYSRFDFRLHKRAHALFEDKVDCIFFINQSVTIKEEKQGFNKTRNRAEGYALYIHTRRRPAYNAKSRYTMPDKLLYENGNGYKILAPYLPAPKASPSHAPIMIDAA